MKTRMLWTALAVVMVAAEAAWCGEAASAANPSVKYVARTLGRMARATAERPERVKLLFYGQSITDQLWYRHTVDVLKRRYPHVTFEVENRAIGGFTSDLLIRSAEYDLYPTYADLVFLHDYGPTELVRKMVERLRERTTSEIVMWTSHIQSSDDPEALRKERDPRSKDLISIAADNHCMLIDLRTKWLRMLADEKKKPGDFLTDGCHMKESTGAFVKYGDFIAEDLVYDGSSPDPVSGTVVEIDEPFGKDPWKGESLRPRFDIVFEGNRVEAVFSEDRNFWKASPTKVLLDGREMPTMKELFYHDRPSSVVSWMPMVLNVEADTLPVEEDWSLTFLEGTRPDGKPVKYRVDGSVTGFDGFGTSTNDFRSVSGRVKIAAKDFHIWQFDHFGIKDKHPELTAHPGMKTFWTTRKTFTDRFPSYHHAGERRVIVSGCANGRHTLSFIPTVAGRPPQIAKLVVHRPAGLPPERWPELDASDRAFYNAIYAPTVVGEQPNHTHKEMVRLPDGELRYYGTDKIGGVRTNVFSVSRDRGLSWKERLWDAKTEIGPMAYCPWGDYYFTGDCLGNWKGADGKVRFRFVTTKGGPTDLVTKAEREFPIPAALDFFRPMQPFGLSRTIAFGGACSVYDPATKRAWERPSLIFSDDDGATWRATVVTNCVTTGGKPVFNDKSLRWDNGCCEPTVVELSSGELWMACRASLRHHYLFKSKDGGRTWSKPEPMRGFYASNTMPTFLKLRDGRILFFWNNTEPLAKRDLSEYPELPAYAKTGTGETVFTNRDALHVAISEDDGKTWIGFREVALNALRNCEDYRARGNDRPVECDKSVHQTQPMEMPDGKILLPYGQGAARRICIFDLRWIYEKERFDDFWWGTEGLSNQLSLKSLNGGCRAWDAGHCAFNRLPGASIVREPDTGKDTIRECLQVCRIRDERLVSELQGVAWNFPAALKGELEIECRIDGAGFNLSLCDRWIGPGDEHAKEYAALSVPVEAKTLGGAERWTKLRLVWDWMAQSATLFANGKETSFTFPTKDFSPYGPSYLHVQTRATNHDPKGTYFRSFRMRAL